MACDLQRAGLATLFFFTLLIAPGCATDRPIVKGLFEEGGVIYRDAEQEEWGSRSTLKIRGIDF